MLTVPGLLGVIMEIFLNDDGLTESGLLQLCMVVELDGQPYIKFDGPGGNDYICLMDGHHTCLEDRTKVKVLGKLQVT